MSKDIIFILFGSTICIAFAVGAYFIGRSNRKFIREQDERRLAKKQGNSSL